MKVGVNVKAALVLVVMVCLVGCPLDDDSDGASGADSAQDGGGVPAPADLVCESNGLDVFLSWQNGAIYDLIQVSRNGVMIAELAGSVESVSDTVSAVDTYAYAVVGVVDGGVASPAASCEVEVTELPPVEDVVCEFRPEEGEMLVSWSLPAGAAYDGIRISRNGVILIELAGGATSHVDGNPAQGTNRYEVQGTLGVYVTVAAACEVTVTAPAAVLGVSGSVDQQTGDILLQWQNGSTYDEILVTCGGDEVARLDGGATSFRFVHQALGIYSFAVYGRRGDCESEPVWWEGQIGRLQWNPEAGDSVAGYNVYVWPMDGAAPDTDTPTLAVEGVSELPLCDLMAAGGLPPCRERQAFNIALAAYDPEGVVSDLSDPLTFNWQVLCEKDVQ